MKDRGRAGRGGPAVDRRAAAPRRAPSRDTACVLASGGLDSAVLLLAALRRYRTVQPLYVRAGLRWEAIELAALRRILRHLARRFQRRLLPLRVIDVPMRDLYNRHWSATGRGAPGYDDGDASVYIPGRNISLFSKAATFCALNEIPVLVSGILSANPFPDGSPAFLHAMEKALGRGLGVSFRIRTPFRRLTKDRVIRMGRDLPLHRTFSCINPKRGRHCGDCCKCKERIDAFLAAGIPDRTGYAGGPGALAAKSTSRLDAGGGPAARATTRQAPNNATSVR